MMPGRIHPQVEGLPETGFFGDPIASCGYAFFCITMNLSAKPDFLPRTPWRFSFALVWK
jgi:hypothetical protein